MASTSVRCRVESDCPRKNVALPFGPPGSRRTYYGWRRTHGRESPIGHCPARRARTAYYAKAAIYCSTIRVIIRAILHPLPDVAVHVIEAERVGSKRANSNCLPPKNPLTL